MANHASVVLLQVHENENLRRNSSLPCPRPRSTLHSSARLIWSESVHISKAMRNRPTHSPALFIAALPFLYAMGHAQQPASQPPNPQQQDAAQPAATLKI